MTRLNESQINHLIDYYKEKSVPKVEPGTLVYMHSSAANGGEYYGLAFVHEAFENSSYLDGWRYNLVGFQYSKEGGCLSTRGWLEGVTRAGFTVISMPEDVKPPMRDGYYERKGYKGHQRYYMRWNGKWKVRAYDGDSWVESSLIVEDNDARLHGLEFLWSA